MFEKAFKITCGICAGIMVSNLILGLFLGLIGLIVCLVRS